MKAYLNRAEKEHMVALVSIADWLEREAEKAQDKDQKRWLRTARTMVYKAADAVAATIPKDAWTRVLRLAENYSLTMRPTDKADIRARMNTEKLTPDDIYSLADFALAGWCWRCGEDPGRCELRQVLEKLEVPGATDQGSCQYRQGADLNAS